MLEEYNNKNDDLKIIAINLTTNDDILKVFNYVSDLNYSYSFITDPTGEISNPLSIEYIPYVVLLDEKGIIQYKGYAPNSSESIKNLIQSIE